MVYLNVMVTRNAKIFADQDREWRDPRVLEAGDSRKANRFRSTTWTSSDRTSKDGTL